LITKVEVSFFTAAEVEVLLLTRVEFIQHWCWAILLF